MHKLIEILNDFENGPKQESWAHSFFTQKSIMFFCLFMILCLFFFKKDPDFLFSLLSFSVAIITIQFFKEKREAKDKDDQKDNQIKIDCFLVEESKKEAKNVTLKTVLQFSNLIAFTTLKIAKNNAVLSSCLFMKTGITHLCLTKKLTPAPIFAC